MNGDRTETLGRLWRDIPTGNPPIGAMLEVGRTVRRRRRAVGGSAIAFAMAAVTAGGLGLTNGDERGRHLVANDPAAHGPRSPAAVGLWQLSSADVGGKRASYGDNAQPPTLRILAGGRGQAIAGCTVVQVRVTISPSEGSMRFQIESVGSMLSCPFGSVDPTRGRYLEALHSVTHLVATDKTLILSGGGAKLRFISTNLDEANGSPAQPLRGPQPSADLLKTRTTTLTTTWHPTEREQGELWTV
ncbi:hypothetical protein FB382_002465 [Nocardioides ginsengisegetis]|uniref:META domain-containing protein n=1 Tax=Nocardioides ginsengisegetis TaxID=661491 RepID=A0A7W3J122_9ACTN|nr:hypothetical protein [Nocardioides ginsengisegetis]